jgi:metal-responsive CopG/Arc/MetJ family transcriptional regulator
MYKAIQTPLHSFIDDYDWKNMDHKEFGADAIIIIMLYNNHIYNQDTKSTQIQDEYKDLISASTHLHLEGVNCLETIKREMKKFKKLAKYQK